MPWRKLFCNKDRSFIIFINDEVRIAFTQWPITLIAREPYHGNINKDSARRTNTWQYDSSHGKINKVTPKQRKLTARQRKFTAEQRQITAKLGKPTEK